MMIEEDLRAGVRQHFAANRTDTLGIVEVGADEEVCFGDEGITESGLRLVDLDLVCARHPVKERGESVRDDEGDRPLR